MSYRVVHNNQNSIVLVDQWLSEYNNQWSNQLGQIAGTRRVILAGTAEITQWVSPNIFDVQGQLRRALEADGFDIVNVRMAFPNYFDYKVNIEIECNVYPQYSGEQVRYRAIQILESITRSFGTTIKVFYNTQLQVTFDAGISDGSAQQYQNSNPPNYNTNFPPNYGGINNGSDFWSQFGGSLGLSTPYALVGGTLLLIFLLRR